MLCGIRSMPIHNQYKSYTKKMFQRIHTSIKKNKISNFLLESDLRLLNKSYIKKY